jgi:hypothetical protein
MGFRQCAPALGFSLVLAGCGYPGEPLPPALNRPVPVADLNAVEQGTKIVVHFTMPKITTEGLPIPGTPEIEIRIGPLPGAHWEVPEWERNSERVPADAIRTSRSGVNTTVSAAIDTSKLYGKTVVIGARVHGPSKRDAGWSRFGVLQVVAALPRPEGLQAKYILGAVQLEWHAAAPQFRIFRRIPSEPDWDEAGESDRPSFSDATIDYGKTYEYYVQAVEKAGDKYAESEPSATLAFKPEDRFAPAVPAGLTAVPGTRTIELVWERNVEKDFAAYRVYRDGKKIADGLTAPAFSDKDVKAGTKYSYEIGAIDTSGNESAHTQPVEALIP